MASLRAPPLQRAKSPIGLLSFPRQSGPRAHLFHSGPLLPHPGTNRRRLIPSAIIKLSGAGQYMRSPYPRRRYACLVIRIRFLRILITTAGRWDSAFPGAAGARSSEEHSRQRGVLEWGRSRGRLRSEPRQRGSLPVTELFTIHHNLK